VIALVTGGTRGIGLAMVEALVSAGHTVAVAARQRGEIPGVMYIQVDLSQSGERRGIIQRVAEELGGVDVLVNNAGAQQCYPAVEYSAVDWQYDLALLLTAPFDLSQQAARHMLANGGGHIVNILSTSSFQGARNIVGYTAAKHGLLGLTRALAVEWAPLVRVNAIAPGLTDTDMARQFIGADRRKLLEGLTPAGRFVTPAEVAGALMFLVNSTGVYGQTIVVDGGWLSKNG
jgi:NAD(P)-dependent dehydrogenase (short-subunit alcohol dehydrogenase family)